MSTQGTLPPPQRKVVGHLGGKPITSLQESFRSDFPDAYRGYENAIGSIVKGSATAPRHGEIITPQRKSRSLESIRLEQGAVELSQQMQAQGFVPAMVVNLNTWPIKVNGVLHDEVLPAAEIGKVLFNGEIIREGVAANQSYSAILIDWYAQDTRDRGDGNWTCHAFVPMQLAKDYVEECKITKWGGVFYYAGRHLPDDPHMPPDLRQTVETEWAGARKKQLGWARATFNIADRAWNSPQGDRRIIDELTRKGGVWLMANGYVREENKPKWLDFTHEEAISRMKCPACPRQVEAGSIKCECGFVFDPRQAFLLGLIQTENASLNRLSKEQLAELGLDPNRSIAHLIGAAPAAPVASAEPEASFEQTGELPIPDDEASAPNPEPSEEELERLTAPDSKADTPKPDKKKPEPKKKSEQQRKAEESLGE